MVTIGLLYRLGESSDSPFFLSWRVAKKKSLSKTPAPPSERISGSRRNPKGSAASSSDAKNIRFSTRVVSLIASKVLKYNEHNPKNRITMPTAKAVVRRGFGAYSTSHRPTVRGGKPNSRTAWGLARLSAFMRKKSGSPTANGAVAYARVKKTYTQDNDLL